MDKALIESYLTTDYTRAVKFYDERANSSKLWYRIYSIYVFSASATLTPLIAFAPHDDQKYKIFTSILSTTVVLATSLLAYLKSHENWLSYRSSWDALQRERRLYETGAGAYKSLSDRDTFFVEQIESILAKENAEFYARHTKTESPKVDKPVQGTR